MQNFYIFPRDVRGKRFFYCNIVDELTGQKGTAKSVDIRVYLATTLSALTGMRRGEIQALKVDSIRYVIQNPDQAIVEIKQA